MPAARTQSRTDAGRVKPRSDAYVGLLGLSLGALSAAMLFAFLNWQTISEKPKPVQMAAPAGGGARPAAPAPGVAVPPVPQAGGQKPAAPPQVGTTPQAGGNPNPPQPKK